MLAYGVSFADNTFWCVSWGVPREHPLKSVSNLNDSLLQTYGEEEFRKRIENGLDPERFLVRAADAPEEEFIRQMIKKM